MDGIAALALFYARDGRVEVEVHPVLQLIVYVAQHDIVYIRAQVAHLRVEKMQSVFKAHALYLRVGRGVELRPLAAVAEVYLVHILHQLDGLLLADIFVQRAAELVCNVVFSVRKSARAAEAAHNIAHGALRADLHLFPVYRAAALRERTPQLKHGNFQFLAGLCQLICGKYTAGACADNYHIIVRHRLLPPYVFRFRAYVCAHPPPQKDSAFPPGEHGAAKCILAYLTTYGAISQVNVM